MTYDELENRIKELVPDSGGRFTDGVHSVYMTRPISLADVLRAIEEVKEEYWNVTTQGMIWSKYNNDVAFWMLELPLSSQSQETLDFIGKLLK